MSVEAQMRHVVTVGRFKVYVARGAHFVNPGLYVWGGKHNRLVLPFRWPKRTR